MEYSGFENVFTASDLTPNKKQDLCKTNVYKGLFVAGAGLEPTAFGL